MLVIRNMMAAAVAVLLFTGALSARQTEKIRLLDQFTSLPVSGARFQYSGQDGLSDADGAIAFRYEEGAVMTLSHLAYGEWRLSDAQIRHALQSGVLYWEDKSVQLYPVSVIALRPRAGEREVMGFDFQDKMAHDGGALLNQMPAVASIRKSGSYGFDPVLRGFKYDQLNIVLNGAQCATAACPNRMDPPTSQMAPNMLDRVEVLKGPHALRYGTGFGGTINFIPEKLRFTDKNSVYGRWSGGYESNGNLQRSEGLLGFSGKAYDLGLFAAWSQGDDYRDGEGRTVQADFKRGSFGANLGVKLTDNQHIRLSAARNIARDADFAALAMDLREDDTWMLNARHDITFSDRRLQSVSTTLFGSFVDHLMDNRLKPLEPRMMNAETFAQTRNYGGRTEGYWHYGAGSLYAGMDLRVEGAEGTRVREFLMGPNMGKTLYDNAWQDGRISKTGAFAEYHLQRKAFQFVFSSRLEANHSKIADPAQEFAGVYPETETMQFNPGISAGAVRKIGSRVSAGLWLGRVQRSGSLTERFINYFPVGQDPYELIGNPAIRPEVNNQVDLTFEWKTEHTVLDLDLFGSYLQDAISSVIDPELKPRIGTSPGVRRYVNLDEAYKLGFELTWGQTLVAGLRHQLSVAYTYGQDLQRNEPLPEIAPLDFRYALRGSYLNDKLQPELSFRHVLAQPRISTEYGETETPAFTLVDLKVGSRLHRLVSLSAGVQNLLDTPYYEHLNRSVTGNLPAPIYAPGRNFFVSLSLDFM